MVAPMTTPTAAPLRRTKMSCNVHVLTAALSYSYCTMNKPLFRENACYLRVDTIVRPSTSKSLSNKSTELSCKYDLTILPS